MGLKLTYDFTALAPPFTVILPLSDNTGTFTVDWADGSTGDTLDHTYTELNAIIITVDGDVFTKMNNSGNTAAPYLTACDFNSYNIQNLKSAFYGCTKLSTVSTPNLINVTDMSGMFCLATTFNGDISNWIVSNVTNMDSMFFSASAFNQDIGNWDVSKVTNMSNMFNLTGAFNQNIGGWDVSKVTNMMGMFMNATVFNKPIGEWDVSKVTTNNMSAMFYYARAFNQDISNWVVSNVTNMDYMFYNAHAFNQDIGSWDVGKITNMDYMFYNASAFNQDIGSWDVSNVTSMNAMLDNSGLSIHTYDCFLYALSDNNKIRNGITIGVDGLFFSSVGKSYRDMLQTVKSTIFSNIRSA